MVFLLAESEGVRARGQRYGGNAPDEEAHVATDRATLA